MTDNYKLVWECMNGGKIYLHLRKQSIGIMLFKHTFEMPIAKVQLLLLYILKGTILTVIKLFVAYQLLYKMDGTGIFEKFGFYILMEFYWKYQESMSKTDHLSSNCFKAKKAIRKDSFFRSNAPVGHIRQYKSKQLCKENKVFFT